jgi:hypothetical protein
MKTSRAQSKPIRLLLLISLLLFVGAMFAYLIVATPIAVILFVAGLAPLIIATSRLRAGLLALRQSILEESRHPDGWEYRDTNQDYRYDVFICHASEDKEQVAEPLARMLIARDLKVWYDKFTLTVGDSLRRKIDEGLAQSRYGVVILSSSFFKKNWPRKELDGLAAREDNEGHKVILPVWHQVDQNYVVKYSPTLADRLASRTKDGLNVVLNELLQVISETANQGTEPDKTPERGRIPERAEGSPANSEAGEQSTLDEPTAKSEKDLSAHTSMLTVQTETSSRWTRWMEECRKYIVECAARGSSPTVRDIQRYMLTAFGLNDESTRTILRELARQNRIFESRGRIFPKRFP